MIIIITSSGMIEQLDKSKLLKKSKVYNKVIVFCNNQERAKRCKEEYPKIVYSVQITDYATIH